MHTVLPCILHLQCLCVYNCIFMYDKKYFCICETITFLAIYNSMAVKKFFLMLIVYSLDCLLAPSNFWLMCWKITLTDCSLCT